jgi:chorismate synthase
MRGSAHNDPFYYDADGQVRTRSNHHGGILGGISTGMPVLLRAAFKPTPSIGLEQDSVSLSEKSNAKLVIEGRHDPCIVLRAAPVVEAAMAIVLYDFLLDPKAAI